MKRCFWLGIGWVYLSWLGYRYVLAYYRPEARVRRSFRAWKRAGVLL